MNIDIRRAIEALVPDAKWDFSVSNEGGDESQYNAIGWTDERTKPTWVELVTVADNFAKQDILRLRQNTVVGPLQIRKALRQTGKYTLIVSTLSQADEETQEAWEYASEIRRLDPMIEGIRVALGMTEEEVDSIFALATTL